MLPSAAPRHLDFFASLPPGGAAALRAQRLFPNRKEESESAAAWRALAAAGVLPLPPLPPPVRGAPGDAVLVVGDGSRPRTAALLAEALRGARGARDLTIFSIDPALRGDSLAGLAFVGAAEGAAATADADADADACADADAGTDADADTDADASASAPPTARDVASWLAPRAPDAPRLVLVRSRVQDVRVRCRRAVLVLVHAHVSLGAAAAAAACAGTGAGLAGALAVPCCDWAQRQAALRGAAPACEFEDPLLLSDKRLVRVWGALAAMGGEPEAEAEAEAEAEGGAVAPDAGSGLAAEAEAAWRRLRAGEAARLRAALPRLARGGAEAWLACGAGVSDGGAEALLAAGADDAADVPNVSAGGGGVVAFLSPSELAAAGAAPFLLLALVVARRRTKGATFVDVANVPPAARNVCDAGPAARWAAARAALALHAHRDAVDGRDRVRAQAPSGGRVVDLFGLGRRAAAWAAGGAAAGAAVAPRRAAQLCFAHGDARVPAFAHSLAAGDCIIALVPAAGAGRWLVGGALAARGALLAHDAARRAGVRRDFFAAAGGAPSEAPPSAPPARAAARAPTLVLAPPSLRGAARALLRAAASGFRVAASLERDPAALTVRAGAPPPAGGTAARPIAVSAGRGGAAARLVVVRLVPPLSFLAAGGAGLAFSSRLSRLANFYMRQQAANAAASTVGGGAFLCRQIALARRAARLQMRVAARLGDARLFARAALHTVYVECALLRWRRAARRLRALRAHATAAGDGELLRMVAAAAAHARRARALAASGALQAPVAHFALAVTLPAVGAGGDGEGEGGVGGVGAAAAGDLLPRYASDEHYDELHRLRATVPRQALALAQAQAR
jgi:hypothetical protein